MILVYDQDEPVCGVERIFQSCGIKYQRARNCLEAREVLRGPAPPHVVVTDLALPDGDWLDILRAANPASAKTPVIVASRLPDIKLYLDVLDRGAHDFVVPPFPLPNWLTSSGRRSRPMDHSPHKAVAAIASP